MNSQEKKRKYEGDVEGTNKKCKTELISPSTRLSLDTLIQIGQYLDITSLVQCVQVNKQWNKLKDMNDLWGRVYENTLYQWKGDIITSYWEDGNPGEIALDYYNPDGDPLYTGTGAYQEELLQEQIQMTGGETLLEINRGHISRDLFKDPIGTTLLELTEESSHPTQDNYYFYPPGPFSLVSPQEKCKRLFYKYKGKWKKFVEEVLAWLDFEDMYFLVNTIEPIYVEGNLEETLCNLFQKSNTWGRLIFFSLECILLSRDIYSSMRDPDCLSEKEEENFKKDREKETLLTEGKTIDESFVCDEELWKQFGKLYVSLQRFPTQKIVMTYNSLYRKYFKDHPFSMLGYSLLLCEENASGVNHWSNNVGKCNMEDFEDELPLRLALARGLQRLASRAFVKKSEPDAIEMGITSLKDYLKGLIKDIIKIHDLANPNSINEDVKDISVKEVLAALEIGGKYEGSYGTSYRLPICLYGHFEKDEKDSKSTTIPIAPKENQLQNQHQSDSEEDCTNTDSEVDNNNKKEEDGIADLDFEGDEYQMELEQVASFLREIGWTPQNPMIQEESLYGKLLEVSRIVHQKYGKPLFDPECPEDKLNNFPMFAKNWICCTGKSTKWVPIKSRFIQNRSGYSFEDDDESKVQIMNQEELEHFGTYFYDKQDLKIVTEEDKFISELRTKSLQTINQYFEQSRQSAILHRHFPHLNIPPLIHPDEETPKPSPSPNGVVNDDLVFEKENFRDLCYSLLQEDTRNKEFDIQNSAMDVLQVAAEGLLLQIMQDANLIHTQNYSTTLHPSGFLLSYRFRLRNQTDAT